MLTCVVHTVLKQAEIRSVWLLIQSGLLVKQVKHPPSQVDHCATAEDPGCVNKTHKRGPSGFSIALLFRLGHAEVPPPLAFFLCPLRSSSQ